MFHVKQPLFVDVLIDATSRFGITLTNKQISALTVYYQELERWNRTINLTSLRDPKDIAIKHFLDSLLFSQALELRPHTSLLDVGSGAGFPGLPLKILLPELHVTLLEPNGKKTAFLRHVIGTLELMDVSAVSKTLREFSRADEYARRFSYLTTRAVAAPRILPFAPALLEEQGRVLACLGKAFDFDPGAYGFRVMREFEYDLPHGYGHRVLTVLEPIGEA